MRLYQRLNKFDAPIYTLKYNSNLEGWETFGEIDRPRRIAHKNEKCQRL